MPRGTARDSAPSIRLQEKHYQKQLLDYALLCGWLAYHDYHSRWNAEGFPDTWLTRVGRLVIIELKVKGGRYSKKQKEWLSVLRTVPNIEVYSWLMPDDWEEAERVLR